MARSSEPPSEEDPHTAAADRFDDDQPTPVLAAGTRDSLAEQAREAARRAHAIPNEDVASLAHDVKTPLTVIMLEAMQIEQRLGARTSSAVARGLERIAQNAAYIDRLVSDLLDMSSADAGRLDLRVERLDLTRLLREAVSRAVPTPDRERVRVEIRDVLFVAGDEIRIERVVTNLLHNALKYCERGPITVRLDARGAYACVSVIDSGPGLTAEESRRVFDRFRRGGTAAGRQGYGLGLYTSRRIIEAHKGRIGIASQPGRGSRFFFELPAVAPHHMGGRIR